MMGATKITSFSKYSVYYALAIALLFLAIDASNATAMSYETALIDYPGSPSTTLLGINDKGDVVGQYAAEEFNGTGGRGAFAIVNSQYIQIQSPNPPQGYDQANGINNSGQIVGQSGMDLRLGYVYNGGVYSNILPPGADSTPAMGINDKGDIVGWYGTISPEYTDHSYLLSSGKFTSIDYPDALSTFAMGINNKGEIVGDYSLTGPTAWPGQGDGFLYSNGKYTTIAYSGADATSLLAINDLSDILGYYYDLLGSHPFLYHDGQFIPLDLPGTVTGINDRGQIVGYIDGHGFVATPVPEPSTLLLVGTGLIGLFGLGRKKLGKS